MAILRNNPVLRREVLRFARRWWAWVTLVVIVWLPLSILTRAAMNAGWGMLTVWQSVLLGTLQMVFRPDLLVAFFVVYRSACSTEWHSLRRELAVTFLTPLQIVAGKAAVPVLLLLALNAVGFLPAYWPLMRDPALYVWVPAPWKDAPAEASAPPAGGAQVTDVFEVLFLDEDAETSPLRRQIPPAPPPPAPGAPPPGAGPVTAVSAAVPVAAIALVEDFFYAVLVVMIALRSYLFRSDAILATLAGLGRLALAGLLIVGAQWGWELVYVLLPMETQMNLVRRPIEMFLYSNAFWFTLVLPAQGLLILYYFRAIKVRMGRWLEDHE